MKLKENKLFKKIWGSTIFRIFVVFAVISSIILCAFVGYTFYAYDYRYKTEPTAISEFTNTTSMYEDAAIDKVINQYPSLSYSFSETYLEDSYVIPGLQQTRTLDTTGSLSMCTSMTPQGICTTEKYIFISAYCHTKEHNSVLYMLNKETHEFIKEIIVDGQYHLGNICYDSKNKNIWCACTGTNKATGKKCAYLNALSLDSILSYSFEDENKPLHFLKKYALAEYKNASFISYYEGNIFVGVYYEGLWESSYVQRFPINEQGGLDAQQEKGKKGIARVVYGKEKAKISECCQGFYFTGDVLMLMQSSGPNDSTIQYFYESNFEKDINKLLEQEKEYDFYLQKLRVAENFSMQMENLQEQIQVLEEEKEELEKQIKEDEKDREEKEETEEELSPKEKIKEIEDEMKSLQEEYDRLNVYYVHAMDSVPEFDEEAYKKACNSTKTYSIMNEKASGELMLPPRLEQAMVSETEDFSKMYLLFESAAYSYRAQSNNVIDRVLVIDF